MMNYVSPNSNLISNQESFEKNTNAEIKTTLQNDLDSVGTELNERIQKTLEKTRAHGVPCTARSICAVLSTQAQKDVIGPYRSVHRVGFGATTRGCDWVLL